MAKKIYYKTIRQMEAQYDRGRAGTPYYHNTPTSQEFYKAAKFAEDWCNQIDELFEAHQNTWQWYIHSWSGVRRNGLAGKGSKRTPKQAVAELLDLMKTGKPKWIASVDYGMPAPCWEKWNSVIQHGFDLINDPDFNYADEMSVDFVQTSDGKPPKNTFSDLVEAQ